MRGENFGPVWYLYLSNNFHISNTLIHFFTYTYFKKLQKFHLKLLYQTPPNILQNGIIRYSICVNSTNTSLIRYLHWRLKRLLFIFSFSKGRNNKLASSQWGVFFFFWVYNHNFLFIHPFSCTKNLWWIWICWMSRVTV